MLNELNNKIGTLEEKIDKIGTLEEKIGTLEEKIDKIETLEGKIGTLEEKISSNGQYLLSIGTAQIDGAVVRLHESKIYEFEVTKHLSGLDTNKKGVVFNSNKFFMVKDLNCH